MPICLLRLLFPTKSAILFKRLSKKELKEFVKDCEQIQNAYIEKLNGDVSWFCKKFDYRYDEEPWYDSKDAVERSMKFLRSDIHRNGK